MKLDKELPLVSIMIPNYNHSRYLDQGIQSALNRSYMMLSEELTSGKYLMML